MQARLDALSNSQRAGPFWDAAQLQKEFYRYGLTLLRYANGGSDVVEDDLMFRFDILWSRISIMESGLNALQSGEKQDTQVLFDLAELLDTQQEAVQGLTDDSRETAMVLFQQLHELEDELNLFTIDVKEIQAHFDKSTRDEFVRMSDIAIVIALFVGLASLASTTLFFIDARRQRENSSKNKTLAEETAKAYRAKSDFISTVNHELRTPLTSIRGALAILEKDSDQYIPEHLRRVVSIAHRNSQRLETLINDVLDLEKIEVGLRYDLRPLDLRDCILDAVSSIRAYNNQINLIVDVPEEPVMVLADSGRAVQVLSNLLSNAIKFSSKGGDVIVSLTCDENAEIRVQDFGVGIPEDFYDKVFERFSQADSSATRKFAGSGLGMCISKSIVEAHRGSIRFESEVGIGTTFIVEMPLIKVSQDVTQKVA